MSEEYSLENTITDLFDFKVKEEWSTIEGYNNIMDDDESTEAQFAEETMSNMKDAEMLSVLITMKLASVESDRSISEEGLKEIGKKIYEIIQNIIKKISQAILNFFKLLSKKFKKTSSEIEKTQTDMKSTIKALPAPISPPVNFSVTSKVLTISTDKWKSEIIDKIKEMNGWVLNFNSMLMTAANKPPTEKLLVDINDGILFHMDQLNSKILFGRKVSEIKTNESIILGPSKSTQFIDWEKSFLGSNPEYDKSILINMTGLIKYSKDTISFIKKDTMKIKKEYSEFIDEMTSTEPNVVFKQNISKRIFTKLMEGFRIELNLVNDILKISQRISLDADYIVNKYNEYLKIKLDMINKKI